MRAECAGYMGSASGGMCSHPIRFKIIFQSQTTYCCGWHLARLVLQDTQPGDLVRVERLS